MLGLAISGAPGTIPGMMNGASGVMRRLFDPSIQGSRSIPSLARVPVFILWMGIFETSKIAPLVAISLPLLLGQDTARIRL